MQLVFIPPALPVYHPDMKYLLLPLILLVSACTADTPVDKSTDEAAVRRLLREIDEHFGAGDFEAALRFYAPDAMLFAPGQPVVRGNEAIRAELERVFGPSKMRAVLTVLEVQLSQANDMAYVHGTAKLVAAGPVEVPSGMGETKWLAVLVKQPDGTWRIAADIFNAAG